MEQRLTNPADSSENTNVPPGWGTDELTKFLDNARVNQHATYFGKQQIMEKISGIDEQFSTVTRGWRNPHCNVQVLLLHRCHSAFRAATGLAMAGQACEATVICRSMLEFAAYAVRMHRDPYLETIWLGRHADDASMKKQKKAFRHPVVLASVKAANRHAGDRFEKLYQRTIDFGGHPNERSVTGNIRMIKESDEWHIHTIMQHEDGPALDHALETVAVCGVISLELFQVPLNARFELLGVNAAILELRKGL